MNSVIEVLVVKPQALDQSNRIKVKPSRSCLPELDTSSKVRWLRSFHIIHIKHKGTRFRISEECRPNPFHLLNNKSTTFPKSTQRTPKVWKIQLHKTPATWQCNRRWLTVSPLHRHMQHQLVKVYPLLLRLSQVRILSHAAVQTKKKPYEGLWFAKYSSNGKLQWGNPVKQHKRNEYQKCRFFFKFHRKPSATSWEGRLDWSKSKKETTLSNKWQFNPLLGKLK